MLLVNSVQMTYSRNIRLSPNDNGLIREGYVFCVLNCLSERTKADWYLSQRYRKKPPHTTTRNQLATGQSNAKQSLRGDHS
jgi:hypothetical protein